MIKCDVEEFNRVMKEVYPDLMFQVVEDDNDDSSCFVYVDDPTLVEDEYEYGQIEDISYEYLGYEDVKIVHEFPENLTM